MSISEIQRNGLLSGNDSLTAFERTILQLRGRGLRRYEIARRLGRSPQTIGNALTVAKEKLGARTLIEAAVLLSREEGPATITTVLSSQGTPYLEVTDSIRQP